MEKGNPSVCKAEFSLFRRLHSSCSPLGKHLKQTTNGEALEATPPDVQDDRRPRDSARPRLRVVPLRSPDISVRATSRRRQPLRRRRYVARGVAEATEATGRRKRRRKLKQPSAASKRRGADRETGPKLQAHELSSGVSSRDLHHMILFVEVAPCLKRKRVVPFKDHIPRLWNVSQSVSQKWCNNSTVTGPSVEEFHTRRNSSEAKAIGFRSDRKCESTSESLSDIL